MKRRALQVVCVGPPSDRQPGQQGNNGFGETEKARARKSPTIKTRAKPLPVSSKGRKLVLLILSRKNT